MTNKKIKGRLNTMGSEVSKAKNDVHDVRQELKSLKNKLRQTIRLGGLGLFLFGIFKDALYDKIAWHCAEGMGWQQKMIIGLGLVLILISVVKKRAK